MYKLQKKGFTLLEIMVAIALFAIVLGATAETLISFYSTMDMQGLRAAAAQSCRGVLADMRVVRNANPNTFPQSITATWPEGQEFPGSISGEVISVNYEDPAANPLVVTVISQTRDLRGRPVTVRVSSALTNL